MILAHIAGVPVEELLIFAPAFGSAGLAVAVEARNRARRQARALSKRLSQGGRANGHP